MQGQTMVSVAMSTVSTVASHTLPYFGCESINFATFIIINCHPRDSYKPAMLLPGLSRFIATLLNKHTLHNSVYMYTFVLH